jgi:hypothetical protein
MTTDMEDRSWTVANWVGERRRANWDQRWTLSWRRRR